jgi:hypothetical protein
VPRARDLAFLVTPSKLSVLSISALFPIRSRRCQSELSVAFSSHQWPKCLDLVQRSRRRSAVSLRRRQLIRGHFHIYRLTSLRSLSLLVSAEGKGMDDQPDLDLLYFQPFIPHAIERSLFEFLRSELFFYRVMYTIKRLGTETQINTPRYTMVFGLDETSRFTSDPSSTVEASDPCTPVPKNKVQMPTTSYSGMLRLPAPRHGSCRWYKVQLLFSRLLCHRCGLHQLP